MTFQSKAYLFGLLAVLAWSTVATAFKISLAHLSPALLVLFASISSSICLLAIVALRGQLSALIHTGKQYWKTSLLLGSINPFIYYLCLFQAYALLPAQEAQAINYTWALTMTILSVPMLKQSLRLQDILAAVICYTGVLIIGTHGHIFELQFSNLSGVAFALVSTLLWAVYWISNTKDKRDPTIGLTLNFLFSLPLIALWCALTGQLQAVSWQGLAGAAYIGAFEMGFTFVLWLSAMKLTSSTAKIANLIFLSPFVSLIFIHFIVGEEILTSTLAGLLFILGGLIIQKLSLPNNKLIDCTMNN